MRKICLAVSMVMAAASAQAAPEKFVLDPTHTYPHFEIDHLGFSTMLGRFNKTEGTMTIDWAKKTGSAEIKIDAASVDTGFAKRDDHLRSPDFLNAAEFPAITYKSTKVVINDDKSATVDGNLTMVGVTKPVTIKVERINCGEHPMKKGTHVCGFDASAKIKRSDFGIKYALPAVGDDMVLRFEVEGTRQ